MMFDCSGMCDDVEQPFNLQYQKVKSNVRVFDLPGVELREENPRPGRFIVSKSRTLEQMRETHLPEGNLRSTSPRRSRTIANMSNIRRDSAFDRWRMCAQQDRQGVRRAPLPNATGRGIRFAIGARGAWLLFRPLMQRSRGFDFFR